MMGARQARCDCPHVFAHHCCRTLLRRVWSWCSSTTTATTLCDQKVTDSSGNLHSATGRHAATAHTYLHIIAAPSGDAATKTARRSALPGLDRAAPRCLGGASLWAQQRCRRASSASSIARSSISARVARESSCELQQVPVASSRVDRVASSRGGVKKCGLQARGP